jgi:hypothetical protein
VRKVGAFAYSGALESGGWASEGSLERTFGWPPAEPYVLAHEEVSSLQEFWKALRVARDSKIEGALRRFGYAAERPHSDDEVVDLLIAAES